MKPLEKLLSDLSEHAGQSDFVFKRLYRLLYREDLFDMALNNLHFIKKEEKKALSPGEREQIIMRLRDQSYRPEKIGTVAGSKKGELRNRPELADLVVQEMVSILLGLLYEPQYSRHNYGYRENRSVHTALEAIKSEVQEAAWFLKGEIPEEALSIDPNILTGILRRRIADERFLNLIRKFINAGYLRNWRFDKTYSKTPVATSLAQTLLNIYLSELDYYIEGELKESFIKGNEGPEKNGNKEIHYFRYANTWLIALCASRRESDHINQQIRDFLDSKLKLELSDECFERIHTSRDVKFLEYRILIRKTQEKTGQITKKVTFGVPSGKIEEIAREKKLVKDLSAKNWMPIYRPFLVNAADIDILSYYNRELYGIYRYYGIAENVSPVMNRIAYLMEYSCLKTFANKHKSTVGKFKSTHMTRQKRWGITTLENGVEETLEFYKGFTRKYPIHFQGIDRLPGRSIESNNKRPKKRKNKKKRKG